MQEEVIEGYHISPQQHHVWRLQRGGRAFRAQGLYLVEGHLDEGALRQALKNIIRRHEILRTQFHTLPGMDAPLQVIADDSPAAVSEIDLRGEADARRRDERVEEAFREALSAPPAARFTLLKLSADRHALLFSAPSLCADSATVINLLPELDRAYAAALRGEELSDEPLQYVDFSEWQGDLLKGADADAGREYWLAAEQALGEAVRALPLEERRGRSEVSADGVVSLETKPELAGEVEAAAHRLGTSAQTLLLACWQILLRRLSGRPGDIFVGYLCDGRRIKHLRGALGPFARYLPLGDDFDDSFQLGDVTALADEKVAANYRRQEFFNWQPKEYAPGGGRLPFKFDYEQWPEAREVGGVRFSLSKLFSRLDDFKLKLSAARHAGGFRLEFWHDGSLFPAAAVEAVAEQYETLLRSVVGNPTLRVGGLNVLSEAARRQILFGWNDTAREFKRDACVHQLFEEQAARTPDALALVFGDEQLRFRQLNERANQLAHRLRSLGVGPEARVGLCAERSIEMFVGLLAALKAGGAYVPLDPLQPRQRLASMLDDAKVHVLLKQRHLKNALPDSGVPLILLDAERESLMRESWRNPANTARPDNLAYVIYTSGSTGAPKGVMVQHRSVVNLVSALSEAIYSAHGSPLRVSMNAPLTFDASVKQWAQLLRGHALCVVPEEIRPDGAALLDFMNRHELGVLDCTPSQLKLLRAAGFMGSERWSPDAVLVGGEAIDEEAWGFMAASGRARFYNVYGPTECTVDATVCRVGSRAARPSIGRPIANVRAYVCDERLNPVPTGLAGELLIGGAGLARGYLNAPGLTAERFIPDPFGGEAGARLYCTGDSARHLADGALEFLGRFDRQLKLRGNRIEPGEIEAALAQHEAVAEAVVVAREEGDGDWRLVAYVVARDGCRGAGVELRGFLKDRLPEYMLPAAFVHLDKLPLTRNGKVDRAALPAPEESDAGAQGEARPAVPRTPIEEVLAGLCAVVLRLKEIGVHDNFFERGGHSLLATQLVSRVQQTFHVELSLRHLFEAPTMAGLAERVEAALRSGRGVAAPPLGRAAREGRLPLSFAQQRLWFLHQLEPGSPVYNVHRVVRLGGGLDVHALEQTLGEVVRRHEVLRTTFPVADGQPFQLISPARRFDLPVVDLTGVPREARESEVMRLAAGMAGRPFDLAAGPLLRAALLRLGAEEHVILLAMHHVVADGWAMGLLVRELAELCAAFAGGSPSPLAELEIQYADFAVWQRSWLQGEVLKSHLDYWTEQLSGCPPVLALPSDRPRPAVQGLRGAAMPVSIPADVTDALKSLSRGEGATLFMTLLAGFKALLHWYTAQEDLVLGADIANRNQLETESLIGFFVNVLALRTDLSGDPTFRQLLRREREVTLSAYAHQDLPFEKVIEALRPRRSLSHAPLVQAVFVFQNAPMHAPQIAGLTLSPLRVEYTVTKFDLVVTVWETDEGLGGLVEYSTGLFDAPNIARMFERYETLLRDAAARPDAALGLLGAALAEADRRHSEARQQEFKDARQRRRRKTQGTPVSVLN